MTALSPLKTVSSLLTSHSPAHLQNFQQPPQDFQQPIEHDYFGPGIVSETITLEQCGRIRFQGSWWSACCEQDVVLTPGKVVQVIGRRNITLLVQPV